VLWLQMDTKDAAARQRGCKVGAVCRWIEPQARRYTTAARRAALRKNQRPPAVKINILVSPMTPGYSDWA